ncbi:hypothetical protein, partial [Sphingomonas sp. CFBP 8760]|uniref:hypothetical protein n=1 Tax=Sphingomonas sp. CFBP 8760 TaxID=2775282 RepID=UPI001A9242DF
VNHKLLKSLNSIFGRALRTGFTMLYRSTHDLCRGGAPVQNLTHSASFHSPVDDAPSIVGTKHLGSGPINSLARIGAD